MRSRRRGGGVVCGLAVAAFVAATVVGTAPAGADDPPPPPVVVGPDSVVVRAGAPGSLSLVARPGGRGGGPVIRCGWHELVFAADGTASSRPTDPVPGEAFVIWCLWPDGRVVDGYPRLVVYDPRDPVPGAAVASEDAARFALARIDFESPRPELSPAGRQLAGVPTWFAVTSRLDYDAVTARAGPVWATVRPVVRDVRWSTGDGATVVCTDDAATVWRPGVDPAGQASTCTHVYEAATRARARAAVVTVTWTILWRNDRDPSAWRVFDTLSISTPVTVEVAELQAAIR